MKYKVLNLPNYVTDVQVGDFVYEFKGHDYGLVSLDSFTLQTECIAVTLNKDNDYPIYIFPRYYLRIIH